ncbi:MAG: polysaccharide biosynthesis protein [Ruminococcaceae bacterium]|nr:polysaccharide biosynthesis protein [Oscillospiraceae bacterium]
MARNKTAARDLRDKANKQQTLVEGALILTVGIALVKIIGALFKIPLGNIIGESGMGYYYSAYNLYLPFYTLAVAGFPVALARQVAENITLGRYKDVKKINTIVQRIFLITGSISFIAMVAVGFFLTTSSSSIFDSNAIYAILAMSPSVLFCCLMSGYRGYYEGMRNMIPTAASQVIEAVGKLVIGLVTAIAVVKIGEHKFLSEFSSAGGLAGAGTRSVMVYGRECRSLDEALNASYPYAAACALLGITLGSALSLAYLMYRYKRYGSGISEEQLASSPEPRATRDIVKAFLLIGIPIALGVLAQNLTQLIDSLTIQGQIKSLGAANMRSIYGTAMSGVTDEGIPNFLWGVYNYGITLYNLVPYLTQGFAVGAIPALAAAWVAKDREKVREGANSVLKLGVLLAFPAGCGIFALAPEILQLLYPGTSAAEICPPMLRVLGIMAMFGAMAAPVNSMLQAVGKQMTPVKLMVIGAVIKLILNYVLVGTESINIKGAPYGSLVFYIFTVVGGLYVLCRTTKISLDIMSTFIKPFIASALCGLAAWGTCQVLYLFTDSRIVTFVAIAVAVVVYIIALFALKAVSKADVLSLPKGEKMAKILEKRGLIV